MKKNKKRSSVRSLVLSVVTIIVLALVAFAIIKSVTGGGIADRGEQTENYYYSSGSGSAYGAVDGGFAVASRSGVQVFDQMGVQTLNEMLLMSNPTIATGGSIGVAYDIGGTVVKIFNTNKVIQSLNTEGAIISGKVNSNGWLALCTDESGYNGGVHVYNDAGNVVFKWLSGSGYVLAAQVSENNESLAVLTLDSNGSKIVRLKLSSEDYREECEIPGEILIDIEFSGKDILAISNDCLYRINRDNEFTEIYNYSDSYLADYSLSDNIVFALKGHQSGGGGRVVTLDNDGSEVGSIYLEDSIISLSSAGEYTAVLTDSELYIYNQNLSEQTARYDASTRLKVIMCSDGFAVTASLNSAQVYPAKGD